MVFHYRAGAPLWRSLRAVRVNVAYLQGSQMRPPGQSSLVRTSHSSGEHTHERALATASDSTTMPPKRSNGALILLSTASPSTIILVSSLFSYLVSLRHQLRNEHEDVHCAQFIPKHFTPRRVRSSICHTRTITSLLSFYFSLSLYV